MVVTTEMFWSVLVAILISLCFRLSVTYAEPDAGMIAEPPGLTPAPPAPTPLRLVLVQVYLAPRDSSGTCVLDGPLPIDYHARVTVVRIHGDEWHVLATGLGETHAFTHPDDTINVHLSFSARRLPCPNLHYIKVGTSSDIGKVTKWVFFGFDMDQEPQKYQRPKQPMSRWKEIARMAGEL